MNGKFQNTFLLFFWVEEGRKGVMHFFAIPLQLWLVLNGALMQV